MATSYNINPSPQQGNGAYGLVPGAISAPSSVWDELNQNVPNYGAMTQSATGDIQGMLNGQLSSGTMMNIGNTAAAHGVATGQPNSALSNLMGMNITGNTTEQLQQQGVGDYNNLTSTLASTQQSPSLMAGIAEENAVNAAAPNPQAASSYAQSLYNQYLNNPTTGTGKYSSFNSGSSGGGAMGNYSEFPDANGAAQSMYASTVAQDEGLPGLPVYATGSFNTDEFGQGY
jgi:hypothetical protein